MKALVFHRPLDVRVEQVPDPRIEHAGDAILRVTAASICGSDARIFAGRSHRRKPQILGHEFMGIVEEAGPRVRNFKPGDRVVAPFAVACGDCYYCRRDAPNHCEKTGGMVFGGDAEGSLAGGQAQYVRVPYADACLRKIPPQLSDERALFLGSVVPAGWTAAQWCGLKGGETVAVFGCGPVGIMAMRAARLLGAARIIAVDPVAYRRELARALADAEILDPDRADPVEAIRALTEGRGADACIDAVGMETEHRIRGAVSNVLRLQTAGSRALRTAAAAARRGGAVSAVGLFRDPANDFPINEVLEKGLRLRGGEPPAQALMDEMLSLALMGRLSAADLITHQMPLDDGPAAYELLSRKREGVLKILLSPWQEPPRAESAALAALDEAEALRGVLPRQGDPLRPDDTSIGAE